MKSFLAGLAIVTIAAICLLCGGCKTVDTGDLLNAQAQVAAATDDVVQSSTDISAAVDEVVVATKEDPAATSSVARLVAARDRLLADVSTLKSAVLTAEESSRDLARSLSSARDKVDNLTAALRRTRLLLAAVAALLLTFIALKWTRII